MVDASLVDTFLGHDGHVSDKWEHYLAIYELELARFGANPIHLLEIGVQNGGSLEIWAKYLPTGSSIVGLDIDPACASLPTGEKLGRVAFYNPDTVNEKHHEGKPHSCRRMLTGRQATVWDPFKVLAARFPDASRPFILSETAGAAMNIALLGQLGEERASLKR